MSIRIIIKYHTYLFFIILQSIIGTELVKKEKGLLLKMKLSKAMGTGKKRSYFANSWTTAIPDERKELYRSITDNIS